MNPYPPPGPRTLFGRYRSVFASEAASYRLSSLYGAGATDARIPVSACRSTAGFDDMSASPEVTVTSVTGST